jgi:hypothetical protein
MVKPIGFYKDEKGRVRPITSRKKQPKIATVPDANRWKSLVLNPSPRTIALLDQAKIEYVVKNDELFVRLTDYQKANKLLDKAHTVPTFQKIDGKFYWEK